jgi:hypothetical protein
MIETKLGQRTAGLVILGVGCAYLVWSRDIAANEGRILIAPAVASPALITIGLGLLLFPIDPRRLLNEPGVSSSQTLKQLPLVWRVLLITGAILGVGNCLAMWIL